MYDYPSCSSKLSAADPMLCRKRLLSLSLNPKFNYRPPQLCETPNRNTRQTETTTPELGEFINNAVETSIPGVNRKLPVQEMEKDNDAILMANRPKRWRLLEGSVIF
ncbi:hypothetical protein GQX74_005074 [Glossina fuscipes]|nr:hypothetical protein GQX74_005074 [Glossina fuscipes]